MKADAIQLMADLIGTNKVLFRIPVYQRNYDWDQANCNRLLDDIKDIIDTGYKHFLGTICYMSTNGNDFVLKDYVIIDGQQRLTTIMILLKALYDISEKENENSTMQDVDDYLRNRNCNEEFKIKLKPVKTDNEQFISLLGNKELNKEGHIYSNYTICRKRIEQWVASGITTGQIMKALHKLEIVGISLKEGEDDPQIIFESINSTGLALSNADLIRNFLLMSDHDQEALYENYWLPMEKNLKKETDYSNLNLFFSHYITFKTNMPVNDKKLYQAFTSFYKEGNYSHESILKELKGYSDIYKVFIDGKSELYTSKTLWALRGLKQLKQTTCYPFLLHIFNDYKQSLIDSDILEKTVVFIHAYLLRRSVCGVPTNTLRGLFTYLYSRIFKVNNNKNKYYESINKFLYTVTSRDIMPSNPEFKNALERNNIYGNTALCRFLLTDIENGDNKEVIQAENLTIEHIMPQSLTMEWRKLFQDSEHETYLHTLGNLSVTGYNSELSNKTFAEKCEIIKQHSKAVILNKDILDKDVWNVDAIRKRAHRLAKIVIDRYSIPKIDDPTIEFEYVSKITLNQDYRDVTSKKLVSFYFEGETYRQNSYALMLLDMVKLLDEKNPSILKTLASEDYSFTERSHNPHITLIKDKQRRPWEIRDGIFIESNLSSSSIVHFISSLLDEYSVNKNDFFMSVVSEELGDDEDEY